MSEPVTLVVARRARAGMESPLERWLDGVVTSAARFPGHQGATILRPRPGQLEYVLIARFATYEDLRRWQSSEECARHVAQSAALVEGAPEVQSATGLETWFSLPGAPTVAPPAAWKMALTTWLVIAPTILVLNWSLAPLLARLPPMARTIATSAILVCLMTWLIMPRVTRLAWRWLHE